MKNEASKILLDPTFSIQVFFMLSSWMLTYNFFVQMSKKERVTLLDLVKIVIRRYFRLVKEASLNAFKYFVVD
jgi:peptidoglycan/LPS O-acetylase OafA/YrhL